MIDQLSPEDTAAHGLGEGIALALKAEDSGDWKPVAMWLARNPALVGDFAKFLSDHVEVVDVLRPEAVPERTGSVVGGLVLREEIGRGAMGVVYRASDVILKRDVAVKMVRGGGEMSPEELARFRFEATVVAALDHPNIVRVLSCDETPAGEPYLVMPLMSDSLGAWLKGLKKLDQHRRPDKEAAQIVRDIANGVHHAHQRGLIHRDLKPANILLDEKRQPHVADFGLARPADATATSEAGTPMYMAPEQALGVKHLTTAVDIHALGVMLFELLTGGVPYGGDIGSIFRQLTDPGVQAPPVRKFRPDVSRDLEAVCLKCLEKDPAKRYASAQALADDLTNFLKDEPVSAQLPGFWDWLRQISRTRPEAGHYSWQVTVWLGALILVANVAIYGMVQFEVDAAWVWATNMACGATQCVVLWWYMLRKFRQLPVTERHSLIIATGCILLYLAVTVAYVPLWQAASARSALAMYPALAAVSGLGLFTLGSTNWSRFFPVGVGMIALVPILAWYPETSPLVYGVTSAVVMWYWAVAKKNGFSSRADRPS